MSERVQQLRDALADRYRIERELGQGGMATVYLAEDVRHGRPVAIKVLRPDLAAVIGAERFVREIRTIAALQHPHILGLIDSGEVQGTAFFVMPFVDGESLRDRLDREKQLPVADAVRIAAEVAAGLDYAHRQGVIHRDIKPENILLHEGTALIADFGIALAASGPTGTRMTETGMSLGTPHYMSPEQAMGEREITARSDVYALGAVLYEMLIGEPPFTGPTAQAIVARVVTEEPRPLVPRRRSIPANVEAAVLTALDKLPADRFATAGEFAAALRDTGYRTRAVAGGPGAAGTGTRPSRLRSVPLLAGALILAALLAAAAWAFRGTGSREPAPVIRYTVTLPDGSLTVLAYPSPDGAMVALAPLPGQPPPDLWIKARHEHEPRRLPGAANVVMLAWSPDARAIAFIDDEQVRRLSLAGGSPVTIADSAGGNPGLAWLDDGSIVFIGASDRSLVRVSAAGGVPEQLFADSADLMWPAPLPGSRALLYTRCTTSCTGQTDIMALDLGSGVSEAVAPGVRAWYVEPGLLVVAQSDGALLVGRFDARDARLTSPLAPTGDRVITVNGLFPLMNVSPSGTLAVRHGNPLEMLGHELVWVDRTGAETPVDPGWRFRFVGYGSNYGWALSPDERRVAVGVNTDEGDDVWVKQLPNGSFSRVSFDSAAEYRPRWMPDGRLMFASNRGSVTTDSIGGGLYARRADGTGSDSLILRAEQGVYEAQWSPDGRWLVFRTGGRASRAGGRDIVALRPGVDTIPVPLIATRYDEMAIAISPDGRWLAYESDETGRTEVFVRPFPDTDSGKWQVSDGGGVGPLWARGGRELYFMTTGRQMVAVPVAGGTGPGLGRPDTLFTLSERIYMSDREYYTPYDIASDGRFLMARFLEPPPDLLGSAPLIVVENWATELQARLGE